MRSICGSGFYSPGAPAKSALRGGGGAVEV
jgi:hypothetical protein